MKRAKRNWPQLVEDQEASGQSVQEYCKSIGIHPNTFYKKRKVREHQSLVEIRPPSSSEMTAIVVNLGHYSVAIRSGFDPQCLKAVLQVIGELP
jgi:hypothetical protein